MKKTLWTKNFTLVTAASALGAVGGIAGGFALSFLVFDETGSTLASALILAIQLVPFFVLPLFLAPVMDRLPRKPFLVAGDLIDGVLYALMGLYLLKFEFSYAAYLGYSLLLACLESFDELAFQSIYPKLIPEGMEQQGYAVSTTLYPILRVLMLPLAGILLDAVGAAWLLVGQGGLSLCAAAVESGIRIKEQRRPSEEGSGLIQEPGLGYDVIFPPGDAYMKGFHTVFPMNWASALALCIRLSNCSGVRLCLPSHLAWGGSLCTSTMIPSAPAAMAAMVRGSTNHAVPPEWLGSTIMGRWVIFRRQGMALMSRVLRV